MILHRFYVGQLVRHKASKRMCVVLDQSWQRVGWAEKLARYTVGSDFGERSEALDMELETLPTATRLNANVDIQFKEKP